MPTNETEAILKNRTRREAMIEDAIIAHPEALGEIRFFVALDREPHRALGPTLRALRELQIGFVLVREGRISRVSKRATG